MTVNMDERPDIVLQMSKSGQDVFNELLLVPGLRPVLLRWAAGEQMEDEELRLVSLQPSMKRLLDQLPR